MPLSWNEIRDRALAFSRDWKHAESEEADAKSFWDAFFQVFGVPRRRFATFEQRVKQIDGKEGYIDLLWKGVLLIEHKSRGKDLDRAYQQARDYFPGIKDRDLPRYILVSDFARFRLYDLERDAIHEFKLSQLKDRLKLFGFIAGYQVQEIKPQDPVNIKAAEQMGRLHDLLKASGYSGHPLEVLLVRVLFCLFADDTGIFQPAQAFRSWLEERTAEDGSDLGPRLAQLFQVLNTPERDRSKALDEQLTAFPYVNGRLFDEQLPLAAFDAKMRETLLDCCGLDWSAISPAIFGALFQSIMDAKARRNLGAHYTSEENILKLIKPLFLDDLWAEFERVKGNRNKLFEFHKKLRTLTFFDPACGCGNFLVISYRELRKLELELLRVVYQGDLDRGQRHLDVHQQITLNVDQFFGIEIEEFPAQIAQVALWLIDHQMNLRASDEFGQYFARIPLTASPHISHGNALRTEWGGVLHPDNCTYLFGNPPFVGAMVMDDGQREDMATVFSGLKGYGVLDYVSAWYWKAARYVDTRRIQCAFVSTNSITQGEQVGLLWGPLMERFGFRIRFAHRTFRWSNEAKGVAAVHCVIVGFQHGEPASRQLFEYEDIAGEPHAVRPGNINAYLVDAPNVFLANRRAPICAVPPMRFGSMPRDGGHLILGEDETNALLKAEPGAKEFIRPYTGADEFLNGYRRFCLWLLDADPARIRQLPQVMDRVEKVREFRLASKAEATRKFAATPSLFCQIAQPDSDYLLVPGVSSERRNYVPIGFLPPSTIASNLVFVVPAANRFHFGIMSSTMHNAWIRYTCGRLKSDFRYSKDIVYNNFPWPDSPSESTVRRIEEAAQAVLDARAAHPGASLADLYDPLTMPPDLIKAHRKLDATVDSAYGRKGFANDAERVAFLFELYRTCTSLLPAPAAKGPRGRRPG
ncbi:MAG TPA: class I SAM-dependent DNA methyltransferase [Usitatibacteraceae bacterium]|nr:class I SAM-dependent DNA methyltransferase [Usitatibacteraceae bacterium]